MIKFTATAIIGAFLLAACDKKADEVLVEDSRRLTTKDAKPKLFATSDERFRNAKPSPVRGDAPENWSVLPSTQFRLLNYRFGESGLGEVWVSLSAGSVTDNVNRWLLQYAQEPLDAAGMETTRKVEIAGREGVWVEAEGTYDAGMGGEAKPGYGLAGVVADMGSQILTVKMVGPANEVAGEKQKLEDYSRSLKMAE